jgi:hypothetical protein
VKSLESWGVRLVVAFLHFLGVAVGSFIVLLLLAPADVIAWLPVTALLMALAAFLVSWPPFMWLVVGWSALLASGCAVLLVSLPDHASEVGLVVLLLFAGGCFLAGGLLELALVTRQATSRIDAT